MTEKTAIALDQKAEETMRSANNLRVLADAYATVATKEEHDMAVEDLKLMKSKTKSLLDQRMAMTRPLDETKKQIIALFKVPLDALAEAERITKGGVGGYLARVEAERRRIEAEAQERARKEREKLEKAAEKAAEKGQTERAEALQEQAENVATPKVAKRAKGGGAHTQARWSAEVTDKMELIKAVAAGTAPHTLLDVNTTVLNKQAEVLKDAFCIPGAKAVKKTSVVVR